jgi:hypothetical protein
MKMLLPFSVWMSNPHLSAWQSKGLEKKHTKDSY